MAGVTRRRAQTRERLIEAAYEVFAEHGIRDAPVELICERAGFTRGAFYSNFDSKEQLFLAVHEVQAQERIDRLRVSVDAAIEAADIADPDVATDVLRQTGELFMESLASDRTWYQLNVEFSAQALRQEDLRPLTADAETRFQDALSEILLTTLDRLGRRLTVDVHSAVLTIIALYEATLKRAILRGTDDRHYVTEVLPRLFAALIVPTEKESR
ncbi:TetR/AcrR family transcriptional regulator [Kutzneria sp. CA-103260]|uniref:TetR/AcrR family transcriptional regulator n=1 Tax=Kutzneria sp. CA-103260 TaxID=2802641 RepID=UPI001BA51C39|nr:TetR/AcrR family transcriptional regulator [Kutzneria sp. CA-103260]QUQ67957.1 TetR family transcriptional regulator [Kutzneria sp. CA-103260]